MNRNWWGYENGADCSWFWKKIVAVKNLFKEKIDMEGFIRLRYTIKQGCCLIEENTRRPNVQWCKVVSERMTTPKHRIILWLTMLNRLRTREKLGNIGLVRDKSCLLCGDHEETVQHLFYECLYSQTCLQKVK